MLGPAVERLPRGPRDSVPAAGFFCTRGNAEKSTTSVCAGLGDGCQPAVIVLYSVIGGEEMGRYMCLENVGSLRGIVILCKNLLEAPNVAEDIALFLRAQVGKDEVLAADFFASEAAFLKDMR